MTPIEKLLAIEDIKNLKARYFRLLDARQWDEWGKLFTPDVVAEFPDDQPGLVYRSRDEMVGTVASFQSYGVTVHHGHTPEIEILSPTTARAIWAMQDMVSLPEGALSTGFREIRGWGHYHETYAKSAEGWRISSLKLTRLKLERS